MKPLILYYSFTGNNELLAKHLADRLDCASERIIEKKERRPFTIILDMALRRRPAIEPIRALPSDHDHVVLLAPLWNKRIANPMVSAIRQIAGALPDYSFVTLCGGERPGQREQVRRELEKLTGKPPVHAWELHVEELVPPGGKPTAVSEHRVTAGELSTFRDELDEIVRALQPAEAGSAPPGPYAA